MEEQKASSCTGLAMILSMMNSGCPDRNPDSPVGMKMKRPAPVVDESADANEDRMIVIEVDQVFLCDELVCVRDQIQARDPCPAP